MNCPNCGTLNDEGRKFCGECGNPLTLVCPSCSTPNAPNVKFCGECGNSLTTTAAVTPSESPAQSLETERRLVSVLFLDLVGFTSIAEKQDAEDTRDLLSAYFDTAKSVIERHGGVVEKFIGDAVMAAWGTPTAHEDDAERAVRTALELIDAIEALGEQRDLLLQARAGVVTGEAATRPGAVSEGMVAGDIVNTASRLQSAAAPGTVLVGDTTVRVTRGIIAFEEAGLLELKGKEEPYPAFRALRVIADTDGDPNLIEPPFVGRIEELRLLKDHLHAVSRDRKARVVSVTGIGGIGKSRLAREFGRYIDGLTETFLWHTGRCPPYGEGITFWALGEMVRRRAGITEGEQAGEARAKLAETVETYVADQEEQKWIEPRLAFLLGIDERPQGTSEELAAGWRTFFERMAESGPVVMVFEDLQWADQGLLDFIDSLLHWSRDYPILVVALSRPEIIDRRPDWGRGQRSFTSVYLDALSDDRMIELVRGLVADASQDVVEKIVGRSEGVPLYAVETIRMLADGGLLTVDGSVYRIAGSVEDLEVPETLHALIAARLDTLDAGARSLVQDAAVLGKAFAVEALASIAGRDPADIQGQLDDLVRREILTLDADPRSPERGQYVFAQGLIREVAYGTLSKSDRRRRHLNAAEFIESLEDDELAAAVATHYLEALLASPEGPESSALGARARLWLRKASDRAMSLGSPDQALALVRRAIPLADDGLERRALLLLAADAAADALQLEESEGYLTEAASLARDEGDHRDEVRILSLLQRHLSVTDQEVKLKAVAADLVDRFGDSGDQAIVPFVSEALGYRLYLEGDYEASLRAIDSSMAGYEALGEVRAFLWQVSPKIFLLMLANRGVEATMLAHGYVDWIREHGDLRQLANALSTAGTTLTNEDPRGSLALAMEGLEVARRGGFGNLEGDILANGIESAIELGDFEKADEMIRRLDEFPTLSTGNVLAYHLNRANLAAYRGDVNLAREAMASLPREDVARSMTWVPRVRSVVLTQGGDPEAGYELALAAIRQEKGGANVPFALWAAARAALWSDRQIPQAASCLKTLLDETATLRGSWMTNARASLEAALAGLDGHREEAVAGFAKVLNTWKRMDLPFDHAATVGDAVVVLGAQGVAKEELRSAESFLRRIGAMPLLERITEAAGATD